MGDTPVYLEIIEAGNALRIAAVDGITADEVVFQVPLKTSRSEIEHLAIQKLRWVQAKQAGSGKTQPRDATDQKKRPGGKPGRGIYV
ncbi:DUF6898 family protein [Maricaulis sp. D1M11]|uniref:DUF6898 family protein n=1 Tax=Maricaulis sp. D1M11 TaxID=3076117 RepID=UPI0039B5093A